MPAPLADILEIWGIDNGIVIFRDGSLGFGLELCPVDITCWSANNVDEFVGRLGSFLNGLGDNIDLQFVQEISTGNGPVLDRLRNSVSANLSDTALAIHEHRIEFLKHQDSLGLIPVHRLKCYVRRPLTSDLVGKPKLFSRTRYFEEIAEERLSSEISMLIRIRDEIMAEFSQLGLQPKFIDERALVDSLHRQWNPLRDGTLSRYDPEDIRPSVLFSDVGLYEKGFSIGGMHHRVISLKSLPDQTYSAFAHLLRDLPLLSKVFVSIKVPNQVREIEYLQTQRRLAFSLVQGKRGVSDIDGEAKLTDLETLLADMIANGEKVFLFSLNIVLQSEDQDELNRQVSSTLAKIRELNGAEAMLETLASFEVFSQVSLPNARSKERAKRLKTSNLSDFLPLYGPWEGHITPRIILKSGFRSLIKFDPFSPTLTNANQIVAGGSGSGKSFLTNAILLQTLKDDPRVFIIDIGASYKKLCENLDGQYIPLSIESNLAINPFDLAPGETSPTPTKIKFLVGLVEMCCKENGSQGLSRLEKAEIEEAINHVYKESTFPRLNNLKEYLLSHDDSGIRNLGKILTSWCGNSPYGKFIDSQTTMELQRKIVSFDLKGLKNYPDLQAVFLYIITDYVWREVQKDRNYKFVIFDECWQLLENEAGAAFIEECYRTFRKYNASAIGISQNIDDFANSKVASAILPNSATKWILMQKGANQARLKEVLQLNDSEMEIIANLHQQRGEYSQAFLMAGDDHSLVLIEPTPIEYWIATTDPKDLEVFESLLKSEPQLSQIEALSRLAKTYPRGVRNSLK